MERTSTPPGDEARQGRRDRELRHQLGRLRRRRLAARRGLAILPTLFTLGNLLCGFAAIFFASRNLDSLMPWDLTPLTFAAGFIFLGMVLDALDGRIARLTRNTSDLGEQLDSMADMVTFGVAPAFLAVQLANVQTPFLSDHGNWLFDRAAVMIACIYVACAALRLARFNIEIESAETVDHMSFRGLPSPGAAGTVASLVLLHQHFLAEYSIRLATDPQALEPWSMRLSSIGMVGIMLLAALAMTSSLRYVHVMNRYVRGRARFGTLAKVIAVGLLLLIHPQGALAGAFVIYALSAPVQWLWRKSRAWRRPTPAAVS